MAGRFEDEEQGVVTRPKNERKLARPPMWKVLIHNDDYTTREFVVWVLEGVFRHSEADATQIMLHVHNRGMGVAGVYPHDVAETKVEKVRALAKENEFPLLCTMEPE
ncbi:ATP-dependent Clp protease adapter ClpS [Vulgatibacter incomptus]|uniref:ATP-dependent Clp protease adapter protein ClpS n=1 Tax=Vulgatibacter incomptus TaxID=1391653 RepID=A0A0K1PGZ2_9BACT|nr:ATP-dependent Clp protease adapter ClpS [Vulgatibacter incomptus]AKU92389.1 ATP-dependent Clp protease adaptor protein ClpS [Vulgatibacter incomptus]